MDVEGHAEKLIREATQRGEFSSLPGEGQPLGKLDMDPDWWIRSFLEREELPEKRHDVVNTRDRLVQEAIAADSLGEARATLAHANRLVRAWNQGAPPEHVVNERTEVWLLDQRERARPIGQARSTPERAD